MDARSIELVIGDVVLYISTVLAWLFVGSYILLSVDGWRKTPIGRGIFFLMFSIAFVLSVVAAANMFGPDFLWRPFFRIAAFICLPVAIGNMLRLLIFLQIEGYRLNYARKYKLPR